MKKNTSTLLSLLLIGCLSGCVSNLSKNACLEADWYEIGFYDGTEGEPRSKFQEHAANCLEHGVHVGREAYYRGRDQGLKIYCTRDKGFDLGRLGTQYNYICPQDLEFGFLAGYTKGQNFHKIESKIAILEQRLRRIETQIQRKKKLLHAPDLSQDRKAELRADIKYLDVENRTTKRELEHLKTLETGE